VWLGQSSWGIYLGQLLGHNLAMYGLGLRAVRATPWLYTGYLLASGVVAVWVGEALLRLAASLRARPAPVTAA
jgi:hypothetical protein